MYLLLLLLQRGDPKLLNATKVRIEILSVEQAGDCLEIGAPFYRELLKVKTQKNHSLVDSCRRQ